MIGAINSISGWFKAHRLGAMLVGLVLIVAVLVCFWLAGINVMGKVSSWWYSRGTEQAHEEIQKVKDDAANSKQVAEEALRQLAAEKELYKQERAKREAAEAVLADRTLNTNQKLAVYEKAINQIPVHSEPTTDVNALCQRAASLGIACQ